MRVVAFFTMMMLLLSCASNKVKEAMADKAVIYYTHGTKYLVEKNYTKALRSLIEAHRLDANNSKINNNLGMTYFFKGDIKNAVNHLKMAIEGDAKNMDARNNLASLYLGQGDHDAALREYRVVEQDLSYEHQYRTLYNMGLVYEKKRQREKATEYFKKSYEENEQYCPVSFKLAFHAYEDKDYNKALPLFNRASMGLCVQHPAPHFYMAKTFLHLKEYLKAHMKFLEIQEKFSNTKYFSLANEELEKIRSLNKDIDYLSRARRQLNVMNTSKETTFKGTDF